MIKKVQVGILTGLLVLFIGSLFLFHRPNRQIRDLPVILKSGRLAVLTHGNSMGFSVNGDSVSGFQYEIIKAFADTLGVELVVTEQNDLKRCVSELQSGDYDIIANFLPITTEWKKEISFTMPIFSSHQVLVQRMANDSSASVKIKMQNELANDSIFISANSPFKMLLEHLSDDIAETIYILEIKNKSTEEMVRLVAEGRIKHTICDEQFAKRFKLKYPGIDVSLPIGFTQQLAWAVHPESTFLLEKLNAFLDDFIGSSAYWELYRKYYYKLEPRTK